MFSAKQTGYKTIVWEWRMNFTPKHPDQGEVKLCRTRGSINVLGTSGLEMLDLTDLQDPRRVLTDNKFSFEVRVISYNCYVIVFGENCHLFCSQEPTPLPLPIFLYS